LVNGEPITDLLAVAAAIVQPPERPSAVAGLEGIGKLLRK
jgi:hypothetical protein